MVLLYFGSRDGTLAQGPEVVPYLSSADFPVVGDFDRDGRPDLALLVVDHSSDAWEPIIRLLLNRGGCAFSAAPDAPFPEICNGMAASLCKSRGTDPRGAYERHLEDLQGLMKQGAGRRRP